MRVGVTFTRCMGEASFRSASTGTPWAFAWATYSSQKGATSRAKPYTCTPLVVPKPA